MACGTVKSMKLSEYQTVGVSNCRSMKLSEYETVGVRSAERDQVPGRGEPVQGREDQRCLPRRVWSRRGPDPQHALVSKAAVRYGYRLTNRGMTWSAMPGDDRFR